MQVLKLSLQKKNGKGYRMEKNKNEWVEVKIKIAKNEFEMNLPKKENNYLNKYTKYIHNWEFSEFYNPAEIVSEYSSQ